MIHISGRWKQSDLKKWITFNRVVKNVDYNEHEDNFKVVVKNTVEDRVMAAETFDMVFVASGKNVLLVFVWKKIMMLSWQKLQVTTLCRMCPISLVSRSSPAGSATPTTSEMHASSPARGSF